MDIRDRITRLYAAIGQTIERDLTKLRAKVVVTEHVFAVEQDFNGGKNPAELANDLHSLIALIAGFEYHLSKWAAHNGKSTDYVRDTFKQLVELQILHDLWNSEKHGYPLMQGKERSGRSPRITKVHRVMQLATQGRAGSSIAMRLGPDGIPVVSGDGSAAAILTGEVVDRYGAKIGDIDAMLTRAIAECEEMFRTLGVPL